MKRRLLALLMLVLLAVSTAAPAFADVIWEPDNAFHKSHKEQCVYHDRAYLVNGEEGYVTVLTAPGGVGQVTNVANGTRFFAEYLWTDKDGTQWAIGYPAGEFSSEGWVCLDDLLLIYDYVCFEEDYGESFVDYDGADLNLLLAYGYSYPGGVFCSVLNGSENYPVDGFRYLYTDENGLRWTYVTYYCAWRNLWVCLDDPLNDSLGVEGYLPAVQVRQQEDLSGELYPPADEVPPTVPLWLIPAVLIVVVAVVTAVLLRRRKRKAA